MAIWKNKASGVDDDEYMRLEAGEAVNGRIITVFPAESLLSTWSNENSD